MSLPYFPMYPTDFEAKTSHLTLAEDGAYNRLLRICWMTPSCTIPDDEAWIMRRLRVDKETFDGVVRLVLDEFFTVENGRLSNAKLTRVFVASNEAHEKRKNAGSKGGKAKSLKTNNSKPSNAVAMPKQPEPEPEPEPIKREAKASPKKGSRIPGDWVLPSSFGVWAVENGMNELAVRREADRFKDYWLSVAGQKGVKCDWFATWRNWVRKSLEDQPKPRGTPREGYTNAGAFGNIPEVC